MTRPSSAPAATLALASFLFAAAPARADAPAVSQDDFRIFMETREALSDERLQKLPEAKRIPALARKNFKMKPAALQAILDKVEAEGGEKGLAEKTRGSIQASLAATALKDRVKEVRLDTSTPHVVTYIVWTNSDPKLLEAEAALVALKAGDGGPITSTFHLTAKDRTGRDVWVAKIGQDRTRNIKEERIAEWATTRYMKLFEVEALGAPN